jgi:hypothetical protein
MSEKKSAWQHFFAGKLQKRFQQQSTDAGVLVKAV